MRAMKYWPPTDRAGLDHDVQPGSKTAFMLYGSTSENSVPCQASTSIAIAIVVAITRGIAALPGAAMPPIVIVFELVVCVGMIFPQIAVQTSVRTARHPILVRSVMLLLKVVVHVVMLILDLVMLVVVPGISPSIWLTIIATRADSHRPAALRKSRARYQCRC